MKIFNLMQIVPSLQSGGVEQGTIDLSNYLASLKIKNFLISNGGNLLSYLNKQYVEHNILPVHSKNFFKMPFTAKKVNNLLKKSEINILHLRSRAPAWMIPYLVKDNLKIVSTFHNVYGHENIIKKIYNKKLSKVDKIVAISSYVKNEIINLYKINPEKIKVINRGIDINFFDNDNINQEFFINFLKKNNISPDNKIILFPGRLTKWKGQIEFLNIVSALKDKKIIFYFIGDDKNTSYKNKFINEINKKNLNKICRVLGNLNSEELKIMYKCSDIVVSAPLKPEGFGRIISESLAMKKIILAYNYGGAKDQIDKLDDLYKINPGQLNELKNKIVKVLEMDQITINNLGNIAREHVSKNFSKNLMLESYYNFYQEL
ncbi:glycosyltransferase [Alphaproteobacteria bacterium]|nr:glycosyltransferase [Alphaproteobacteria bacterium]